MKAMCSGSANAMALAGGFDQSSTGTSGTSIFDPVLTELAYRWFCPEGGQILDPFAGGSVRGVVASVLGYRYCGIDLRPEQIDANRMQAIAIVPDNLPDWRLGDSAKISEIASDIEADFIFSCPPYGSLEVYSDDPRDLSTMTDNGFVEAYGVIIKAVCARLKNNRFACFVVGDYRLKNGNYCNFIGKTVAAFSAAGLSFYNEAILVTAVGSLPVRVGKQFFSGRKLGKTHQNILVFVKGDGRKAAQYINSCSTSEVGFTDDEPPLDDLDDAT